VSNKEVTKTPKKPGRSRKAKSEKADKAARGSPATANEERKDPGHSTCDLIKRVEKSGLYLFHDQRGLPYARIPLTESRRVIPIRSEDFNKWLSMIAWKEMHWAPGREVLYSTRRVLESKAIHDGPEHELHLRVAWHEDAIWIDLDGSKAVRIMPGSWEAVSDPPILFRSFPHQKPLPEPVKNGNPLKVLNLVNLRSEKDFLRDYRRNVNRQHEAVLDSNLLARVIVKWISGRREWRGTALVLLDELTAAAVTMGIETSAKNWPKTPQHLSGSLNYLGPCLEYAGISIERDRDSAERIMTIRLVDQHRVLDLPGGAGR